jgi:hypothetical protein
MMFVLITKLLSQCSQESLTFDVEADTSAQQAFAHSFSSDVALPCRNELA